MYHFECTSFHLAKFFIKITEPTIILIETWPLDEMSDPDLYVAIDNSEVAKNNYDWCSRKVGAEKLLLDPATHDVVPGTYWIAV